MSVKPHHVLLTEGLGVERSFLVTDVSDGVDAVLTKFIADHEAELNERLAPFGLQVTDIIKPTWQTPVRPENLRIDRMDLDELRDFAAGIIHQIRDRQEREAKEADLLASFRRVAEESAR